MIVLAMAARVCRWSLELLTGAAIVGSPYR
jgi:hypothetical protein